MKLRITSLLFVFAAGLALGAAAVFVWTEKAMAPELAQERPGVEDTAKVPPPESIVYQDIIRVENPHKGSVIKSPLTVMGQARGTWFFEGDFPVFLVDWDGRIIAEHYAQAVGEWMTQEYVPFAATLTFENPTFPDSPQNHFSRRGALILKKNNPSGLPEHDDALEISVLFE